jgi:Asp-tRNA(Asn)/Glu-tRNA(Gln) amidotransferase A subunit family amidase
MKPGTDIAKYVADMPADEQEDILRQLLVMAARDPAQIGFPAMLPIELAMGEAKPQEICQGYGISRDEFARIIAHPVFIKAYQEAVEMLRVEGMSFKVKARMQAEAFLATSFSMVQNPATSDNVRADLIKSTVKWAGLDIKAADADAKPNFNIVLNLG